MKKKHKVSLEEATESVVCAFTCRDIEMNCGEIPRRVGGNELVLEIDGERFLIKVTRIEDSK